MPIFVDVINPASQDLGVMGDRGLGDVKTIDDIAGTDRLRLRRDQPEDLHPGGITSALKVAIRRAWSSSARGAGSFTSVQQFSGRRRMVRSFMAHSLANT